MPTVDISVSSAVIVPEETLSNDGLTLSSHEGDTSRKRRQSSTSSSSSKRPRLGENGHGSVHSGEHASRFSSERAPVPASKKVVIPEATTEDKKRGKRLFGGLLGALSRRDVSVAQKRRADIERRQQAKLQSQAEEDETTRQARLETLRETQRRQHKLWEEEVMRTRHSNATATARFLKTEHQPALHYKPFKLRPDEHERISKQIQEAEEMIDRELDEWDRRQSKSPTVMHKGAAGQPDSAAADGGSASGILSNRAGDSRNKVSNTSGTYGSVDDRSPKQELDREAASLELSNSKDELTADESLRDGNDDGGELLEGDEDTVLY